MQVGDIVPHHSKDGRKYKIKEIVDVPCNSGKGTYPQFILEEV